MNATEIREDVPMVSGIVLPGQSVAGAELVTAEAIAEALDPRLVSQLAAQARSQGVQLLGRGGVLQQLTKRFLEAALEAEMDDHLGYGKHETVGRNGGNSRNGKRGKTLLTEVGPVEIEVPRDREGSFAPAIVRKRQRRLGGVEDLIISLTAKGLTTGEVCAHLEEVYGVESSKDQITAVTDRVMDTLGEWQNRPLDAVYPVVFIDAIHVKIRDGQVANRPIYLALAATCDGGREILGLWAGDSNGEGAKFWLRVLTEIKNRGVKDVCMAVCDGLKGLPDAINEVWPRAVVQSSSVHHGWVQYGQGGTVPPVTGTAPGRTCSDTSPARSTCRPVRPGRWRASHLPAGVALRAPR